MSRRIARIVTVPPHAPGFAGPGHLAAPVIPMDDFASTDPFIALMDDRLDIGERQVGGPHPHAGFETVTLLLDGEIYDRDEGGVIQAGEVQWMTAGRGIIHGENVAARGRVRLLQLWLTLPKRERWTTPAFQDIRSDAIPVRRDPGVEVRVYSGESGALWSGTRNHVPVTIAEFTMAPHAAIEQQIPASYNGFVYVIDGAAHLGDSATLVSAGQVGWLDRPQPEGGNTLSVRTGEAGARLVLYGGEPQRDVIVSSGPFIGDSDADIRRLYAEYRAGRFARMSDLARANRSA